MGLIAQECFREACIARHESVRCTSRDGVRVVDEVRVIVKSGKVRDPSPRQRWLRAGNPQRSLKARHAQQLLWRESDVVAKHAL